MAIFKDVELTEDDLLEMIEDKTEGTIKRIWRSGVLNDHLNIVFKEDALNDKFIDKRVVMGEPMGFAYDMRNGHITFSNLPSNERSEYEIEALYNNTYPNMVVVGVTPTCGYRSFTLKVREEL